LAGVDDDPHIESLNMQSSAGWAWNRGKGKEHLLERGDDGRPIRISSEVLADAVEERIRMAEKCVRVQSGWLPCKKNERLPLKKIRLGKTRIFVACPVDYTIVFRMYFGAFVAHIVRHRLKCFSAVGIDSWSTDWTELADNLLRVSDCIVATDVSNFDGSVSPQMLDAFTEIVNEWYDDSDVNKNVRRTLMHECAHCPHVVYDLVYYTVRGNQSGIPATTHINSIVNCIYMRVCWLKLTRLSLGHFHRFVRMYFYGDDMIGAVDSSVVSKFNSVTCAEYLSTQGITVTSSMKDEQLVPYVGIDEATFLKCGFRREGMIWHSLMAEQTIRELTNWVTESKPDLVVSALMANLNDALRFMYHYGVEEFKVFRNRVRACLIANEIQPVLYNYDYFNQMFNGEIEYKPLYIDDFSM